MTLVSGVRVLPAGAPGMPLITSQTQVASLVLAAQAIPPEADDRRCICRVVASPVPVAEAVAEGRQQRKEQRVQLAPRAAIAAFITTTASAAVAATLLSPSGPALASQTSSAPAHTQQQVAQQVADLFRFTNIRANTSGILSGAGVSSISMSAATTMGSP